MTPAMSMCAQLFTSTNSCVGGEAREGRKERKGGEGEKGREGREEMEEREGRKSSTEPKWVGLSPQNCQRF